MKFYSRVMMLGAARPNELVKFMVCFVLGKGRGETELKGGGMRVPCSGAHPQGHPPVGRHPSHPCDPPRRDKVLQIPGQDLV